MSRQTELNKCCVKLKESGISGEDIFNLLYPGCSLVPWSTTIKKFENSGLNPWFFRDYFFNSKNSKSKDEQEDLDDQLEYDLQKTNKWKFIKK